MIKRNIPNFITLCNLFSGCVGIVFALEGNLVWSAYMVGIACIFDLLDGMIARLMGVTSEIGKQLDSLADIVSFGVVPGVLLYKMIIATQLFVLFKENPSTDLKQATSINYLALSGFLVTIFSGIRLANFNIDTRQQNSFIGLPTPGNALLIASLPLCIPASLTDILRPAGSLTLEQISTFLTDMQEKSMYGLLLQPYSLLALTLVSSFLLVAPLPLFALKFKNFSYADNKVRYTFLALSSALMLIFKFLGIPLIIILYIILSILDNLTNKKETSVYRI